MRLINVHTGKLEEFHNGIPPYAILSHTWGLDKEEISYEDMQSSKIIKQGPGSKKLEGCCKQTIRDRLQYAWVDTCCIDKKNSTELHEAINSMFKWYQKAEVCYTYLSDVAVKIDFREAFENKFRLSRWFKRGWTLQELLAPRAVVFYDQHWNALGTKKELATQIQETTGIPTAFLVGKDRLHEASVAQRMSWAATRETKKAEDMAYSLMGLFDINMSMIYGEGGAKAFGRLLREIMNRSADDSILAWDLYPMPGDINDLAISGNRYGGVLPRSPGAFRYSGAVISSCLAREPTIEGSGVSYGCLTIRVPLITMPGGDAFGLLNCSISDRPDTVIGIPLCRTSPGLSNAEFVRPTGCEAVAIVAPKRTSNHRSIRIYDSQDLEESRRMDRQCGFFIEKPLGLGMLEVYPSDRWERERSYILSGNIGFRHNNIQRTWVRFRDTERHTQDFIIALDIENKDSKMVARCHVMIASRDTTLVAMALRSSELTSNIFGNTMASNGSYHLTTNMAEKQQGQRVYFVVALNPLSRAPQFTADVTAELEALRQSPYLPRDLCLKLNRVRPEWADLVGHAMEDIGSKERRLRALQLKVLELKEEERSVSTQLKKEKKGLKFLLEQDSEI